MKRELILGLLVLSGIVAVWLAVGPGGKCHTSRENIDGVVQPGPEEGAESACRGGGPDTTDEMQGARLASTVKSPLLNGQQGRRMYEKLVQGYMVSERENGVRTLLYPYEGISRDIAMIELRFRKRGTGGALYPVTIEQVGIRRRVGHNTETIHSQWELGGHKGVEGHALRVGAAPPGKGTNVLGFGRRYLLQCKVVDSESGEAKFYDSIIKVPENIPPGKMAVITVFPKYPARTFQTSSKPDRKPILGKITLPLPPTKTQWLAVYTHPDHAHNTAAEIKGDGRFVLGKKALGGMLRIIEKGGEGCAWMCVRSVEQHQLTLPQQADRVIKREDLKQVGLIIPDLHIKESFVGPWLKAKKGDTGPIVWKAFRSDSNAFKEFKSTGIIEIQAPPGRYWVSVFYDPGEPDKRRWVTLGRVTIPRGKPQGPLQIRADK